MIKKILVVILVIVASISYAQEGTTSPYSYYGIGLRKFKGTVENKSMGGLSILTDSVHLNLQNPAAYGELKLTAYTLGASYSTIGIKNKQENSYTDNATLDYLAIGIPAGKFGFGFGVIPFSAVGYQLIKKIDTEKEIQSTGTGGLNKVFLATGFKINKNLNVGLDINYSFGNIENKRILIDRKEQFDTRDLTSSYLSGLSLSLGVTYKRMLTDKLEILTSIVSTPSFKLSSKNTRELSTITISNNGRENVNESKDIEVADNKFDLPAEVKFGVGIGQPKKWFVGTEYTYLDSKSFINSPFTTTKENVKYENSAKLGLGGFYIPKYNSLTSYFKRVVYRAGFRYEKTGLNISNQSINEFGISFGVGLPVGNLFSNTNISVEYGQRGTTDLGLVKEEFYNFSISLSLNDKWFRKLKYN